MRIEQNIWSQMQPSFACALLADELKDLLSYTYLLWAGDPSACDGNKSSRSLGGLLSTEICRKTVNRGKVSRDDAMPCGNTRFTNSQGVGNASDPANGKKLRNRRGTRGATVVIFNLIIAVFVVLALGIFAFEVVRLVTAQQELRNACEFAALAGAAKLVNAHSIGSTLAHEKAKKAARKIFDENSVVGDPIKPATVATTPDQIPDPRHFCIFTDFLEGKYKTPDPYGKIVRVRGTYRLVPALGQYLGLGPLAVREVGLAKVPKANIVIVNHVGNPIDDRTKVTGVNRAWDTTKLNNQGQPGAINYNVIANGPLDVVLDPNSPEGSNVQAMPPQELNQAASVKHNKPLFFNIRMRSPNRNQDVGVPPGNKGGYVQNSPGYFTDLVVNIDGKDQFKGIIIASNGELYSFRNLATLVEAARGNLEDWDVFVNSEAAVSVPRGLRPKRGYRRAYLEAASRLIQPRSAAHDAIKNFMTAMQKSAEVHFSFINFGTGVYGSLTDQIRHYNVATNYPAGGIDDFPVPGIPLSPSDSNYDKILGVLPTISTYGQADLAGALQKAVDQLKSMQNRRSAELNCIIVLAGANTSLRDPRQVANEAKKANIRIITIALALSKEAIVPLLDVLNDDPRRTVPYRDPKRRDESGVYDPAGHEGVAYLTDGYCYLITNAYNLPYAFENLARKLVALTR